jgi:glycosyltransferase involved in cell wall biosynthesis
VAAAGTGTLGESRNGLCTLGVLPAPELSEWYGRASIFVLPARRKAFSLSALEAALSECALVLTDLPSLREVWGDAALYVPPGDRLALGAALTDLIDRPSRRHELSDRAKERSRSFPLQEMTDGYLEAYADAAKGGTARSSDFASAV